MKNIRKLIAAALISVFAISAVGCNMITKTDAAIKKSPVAKVGKETITKGKLDERLAPVIAQMKLSGVDVTTEQGKEALAQYKTSTLEDLIMEAVIRQKIKEKNITVDEKAIDEEVNKSYEEIKKAYTDEKEFNDKMAEAGLSEATLKELLKLDQIKVKVYEYITKDEKVEDKEVQDYYNNNKGEFTEQPNTIHVAHILVDTEELAKKAKARLDAGEAFDKVAKEMSKDTNTNQKGGDLGEIPYAGSGMDATFMQFALGLKAGNISTPVQTSYGFHIIKCIEKKEYPVKAFDTVKDSIKETLLKSKKDTLFTKTGEQWKADTKIETKKYEKNL